MQSQALYDVLKDRRSFNLRDLRPIPWTRRSRTDARRSQLGTESWPHEPWRFTVFVGEARRRLGAVLAEAYRLSTPAERFDAAAMAFTRDRVLLAPAWISIGMEPDAVKHMPEWEETSAVAMAVHNMHLMACSLGLGCKWSSGASAGIRTWRSSWDCNRPHNYSAFSTSAHRPQPGPVASTIPSLTRSPG